MLILFLLSFSDPTLIEAELRAHVRFLADDLLEGRNTTERGQRIAARYLAAQMEAYGVEPAYPDAEDPYFQTYGLRSRMIETTAVIAIEGGGASVELDYMKDFDSVFTRTVHEAAPVTFVGYGIQNDDWNDYAGLDVTGHWVVVLEGPPDVAEDHPLAGLSYRYYRGGMHRVGIARSKGALGVIYLKDRPFDFQSWSRRSLDERNAREEERDRDSFILLRLPQSKRAALFGDSYQRFQTAITEIVASGAPRSFTLPERKLTLEQTARRKIDETENVVGILRGTDRELRDEYVVVSAHYDHVGIHDDQIHNGADDNASGTATVLMLGDALREVDRRRSLILLLVSGEEMGLLGSSWFVRHPVVPLEQIVANINLDMVGRNAPGEMGMIPATREGVTTMRPLAEAVNRQGGHGFRFTYTWDRFHKRSDHYNFTKNGIPAIFFFSGTHEDYHQPGDDWHKLDYDKMTRFFGFLREFVVAVLQDEQRPAFLDEEARRRLAEANE